MTPLPILHILRGHRAVCGDRQPVATVQWMTVGRLRVQHGTTARGPLCPACLTVYRQDTAQAAARTGRANRGRSRPRKTEAEPTR
jgi:hypothetical protein